MLLKPVRRYRLAREIAAWASGTRAVRPILVVLHPDLNPRNNDVQVQWLRCNFPDLAGVINYRTLPVDRQTVRSSRVVVFWVQDPVEHLSRRASRQCLELERACRVEGVPIINRPSNYHRVDRVEASRRLQRAGLRTPVVQVIDQWDNLLRAAAGLDYPFVIRNRFGQSGELFRIAAPADLANPRLRRLPDPVRVEWIDASDPATGLYRKYRTFVIGDRVIAHHLQITPNWITRGADRMKDERARVEELEFIRRPSPRESDFRRASRDFGLEVLAYDWGYRRDGEMVVWEANPYPFVHFSGPDGQALYRAEAVHRTYAALLELYLAAAGLPVPLKIRDLASLDPRRFAAAAVDVDAVC